LGKEGRDGLHQTGGNRGSVAPAGQRDSGNRLCWVLGDRMIHYASLRISFQAPCDHLGPKGGEGHAEALQDSTSVGDCAESQIDKKDGHSRATQNSKPC
jgi:hypothetical protein